MWTGWFCIVFVLGRQWTTGGGSPPCVTIVEDCGQVVEELDVGDDDRNEAMS